MYPAFMNRNHNVSLFAWYAIIVVVVVDTYIVTMAQHNLNLMFTHV